MPDECPHRPPCLACPRFGEPGLAASSLQGLETLARSHGLRPPVPIVEGPLQAFRHRARLAIRGRLNSPKIGLFEPDTHRVVHIPRCSIQHPLINHAAAVVRRALVDTRTTCYSDGAQLGVARYLQVVVERSSQTAQIVLVANTPGSEGLSDCLDLIRDRLGKNLHSLWFNANQDAGNTILGKSFERWHGPPAVIERFGGPEVHYPPGAFGQSNLPLSARIIEQLRAEIPSQTSVAEFYTGVGAIGLSLFDHVISLRLNEISPYGLEGLASGLAQLDAGRRARVSVHAGSAGDALETALGADVVIADPPRRGLDKELCVFLAEQPPPLFYYVSCGLDSLMRDAATLTQGGMRLAAITAYNLFPFTEHVECVARFERR